MKTPERILVVSRSTKHCHKAVQMGLSMAQKFNAELYLLHIIYDPFGLEGWNLPVPSFRDEYDRMAAAARRDMDQMVEQARGDGLFVKELIKDGKPADEVSKLVNEAHIDLIIMPANEEGRLEHFLFGHSNDIIIRKLPASIMLVKEKA
jgi:universal stress protein A